MSVILNHPGHSSQKSHGRKGSLTEAEFDALPTGQGAIDALPGTYDQVLRRTADQRGGIGTRERLQVQDAIDGEHGYARDGYIETNRTLYRDKGDLTNATPEVRQQVERIDRLMEMSKLDRDVAVHRGTSEPGRVIPGFDPNGSNVGKTWTHHAFQSTSARFQIAEEFARGHNASSQHRSSENHPTELRIHVPAGTRAVQITGMDRYEGEGDGGGYAEVLLDRGLGMRVVNDHGVVDGIHFLDVEVTGG
ncbi:MAG TPA: ADP-ribosyltransferase [Micromonosporaceae bacterium]